MPGPPGRKQLAQVAAGEGATRAATASCVPRRSFPAPCRLGTEVDDQVPSLHSEVVIETTTGCQHNQAVQNFEEPLEGGEVQTSWAREDVEGGRRARESPSTADEPPSRPTASSLVAEGE